MVCTISEEQLHKKKRLSEIVNNKEIRVVGLRRSGNHAIIKWIQEHYSGKVLHLNDIKVQKNPYRVRYHWDRQEHWKREALGDFIPKDCLIYSYEDYSVEKITDPRFEKKHDLYFGKSKIRYDVLLLRDPFNLLASRLKRNYISVKESDRTVVELWI